MSDRVKRSRPTERVKVIAGTRELVENCYEVLDKSSKFHCGRTLGRPPARWSDDLKTVAGSGWMRNAEDRMWWRALGLCPAIDVYKLIK